MYDVSALLNQPRASFLLHLEQLLLLLLLLVILSLGTVSPAQRRRRH